MKTVVIALLLVRTVLAQVQPPTFPDTPLPAAVCAFASYNQLGDPRWTGGMCAIYPIVGSVGIYGTTTADISLQPATDPVTNRPFVAITSSMRQGVHKSILSTGRFRFLLGGDVGPSFFQDQGSGISVNFSSSFIATGVYQVSRTFSLMLPVRMLYISGIGFNPVAQAGVIINLSKLPAAR